MTVKAVVNYKLTDKTSHNTILKETIDSSYTAQFSDSVVGVKRLRLANEGAIKENIKQFIEKLNHLK